MINRVDIRCSCSPAKQGHFQAIVKDNVFVLYLHLTRGDVAVSPIRASKSELNKEFFKIIQKVFLLEFLKNAFKDNVLVLYLHLTHGDDAFSPIRASRLDIYE